MADYVILICQLVLIGGALMIALSDELPSLASSFVTFLALYFMALALLTIPLPLGGSACLASSIIWAVIFFRKLERTRNAQ